MLKAIDNKFNIFLIPGGISEQIRTQYGKEMVYIKKRKGFIRVALEKKCKIIPSYAFNVNDIWMTFNCFQPLFNYLGDNLRIGLNLFVGYLLMGFPVDITYVMGMPLDID